jgi:hypothetical protein
VLSAAVSSRVPLEYADFVADVQAHEAVLDVLRFCWSLRRNRRSRRSWQHVQVALQAPVPSRFMRTLLQQSFSLYCFLRARTVPYETQPTTTRASYRGYVPRALARVMRRHGIVGFGPEERTSLHARAVECIADVWDDLPGTRVVIWFDNFYRARYLANPARGYSSLNSTVLALLPMSNLPSVAPDIVRFSDALERLPVCISYMEDARWTLRTMVRTSRVRRYLPGEVRVPLDVRRQHVRSLPWTPFHVSEACVSSQDGLLRFLRFAARISERTECNVSPVLVDENVHYRLLKVAWSAPFVQWDVPRLLQCIPPLFGLWHAYKYCVIQVARQFHSCLWYCVRGTQPAGAQVPTSPPLRTYELVVAAILQAPASLREEMGRVQHSWDVLHGQDVEAYQVVATSDSHAQETVVKRTPPPLWAVYASPLPQSWRQHWTCCTPGVSNLVRAATWPPS